MVKKFITGPEELFTEENSKKIAKLGFRLSYGFFYLTNFYSKINFFHMLENLSIGKRIYLCKLVMNSIGVHITKTEDSYTLGIEEGAKETKILTVLADRAEVLQEQVIN